MLKTIPIYWSCNYGTDPELFFSRAVGKVRKRQSIIASEVVIPPGGLVCGYDGNIARDGVQVELHPTAGHCRANVSNSIQNVFKALVNQVDTVNRELNLDIKIDFRQLVTVTPGDLNKMSPDARRLGCVPSKNAYGRPHVEKDGEKFRIRSAAGHMHFGTDLVKDPRINPDIYAKTMDVFVGNTCVMVDRDPAAAIRRKTYGRAGEYRLPKHGFEYRTLSNFWLTNYILFSMVFGMARIGHDLIGTTAPKPNPYARWERPIDKDAFTTWFNGVDFEKIEKAINTNDYELARSNYETYLKPFLATIDKLQYTGVDGQLIKEFDYFLDKIRAEEALGNPEPLRAWFTEDPLTHWLTKLEGHDRGFERFLQDTIRPKLPVTVTFSGVITTTPGTTIAPPPTEPPPAYVPGADVDLPAAVGAGARIIPG